MIISVLYLEEAWHWTDAKLVHMASKSLLYCLGKCRKWFSSLTVILNSS